MLTKRFTVGPCLALAAILLHASTARSDTNPNTAPRPWTILMYGAVDNSADDPFVDFTNKVRRAIDDDPGVELVVMIDRSDKHAKRSTFLGDDFSSTRLYRVRKDSVERLAGGRHLPELTKDSDVNLNSADPSNLQRFIAWGKENFPARQYGLLIYSHANGKTMCPDDRSRADMGIPETTHKISAKERVDFLALELCNMGGIEIAYQWRLGNGGFEVDVLLAIPNAGPPLDWDRAFRRIRSPGHSTTAGKPVDPNTMTAADFGKLVIEEGHEGRRRSEQMRGGESRESAGCYDLRKVDAVKKAVDSLAQALAKSQARDEFFKLRNARGTGRLIAYNDDRSYVDLYDLCSRISASDRFSDPVRAAANDVNAKLQEFMIASFGMSGYGKFESGKNGVFIVTPSGRPNSWQNYRWYIPGRGEHANTGNWAFLKDGATPGNEAIENWFELFELWCNQPVQQARTRTPSESQHELDKLQGEWTMTAREIRGEKSDDSAIKQFKLTIQGNQWIATSTRPNSNPSKMTIQVDPASSPKTIDLTISNGSALLGIYKLDGDTLTVCRSAATGDVERPQEFKTTKDDGSLTVWQRVKK